MGSYNVLWSQSGPLAPVLAWLIAASAFHVACELPLQVRTQRGLAAAAWYAAGGAALASGLWAVHILGTMAAGLPYEIGYSPMGLLATWVATAFLGFLGLGLATGKPAGKSHRVLAGLLVGAGLVLLPLCALASADLRPKLSWYTGPVAMAAITSGLGGVAASFLAFRLNDQGRQWLHRIFRAAASGVVATAATFAQQQVMPQTSMRSRALAMSAYCPPMSCCPWLVWECQQSSPYWRSWPIWVSRFLGPLLRWSRCASGVRQGMRSRVCPTQRCLKAPSHKLCNG